MKTDTAQHTEAKIPSFSVVDLFGSLDAALLALLDRFFEVTQNGKSVGKIRITPNLISEVITAGGNLFQQDKHGRLLAVDKVLRAPLVQENSSGEPEATDFFKVMLDNKFPFDKPHSNGSNLFSYYDVNSLKVIRRLTKEHGIELPSSESPSFIELLYRTIRRDEVENLRYLCEEFGPNLNARKDNTTFSLYEMAQTCGVKTVDDYLNGVRGGKCLEYINQLIAEEKFKPEPAPQITDIDTWRQHFFTACSKSSTAVPEVLKLFEVFETGDGGYFVPACLGEKVRYYGTYMGEWLENNGLSEHMSGLNLIFIPDEKAENLLKATEEERQRIKAELKEEFKTQREPSERTKEMKKAGDESTGWQRDELLPGAHKTPILRQTTPSP